MIVYSRKIVQFIDEIKSAIREILSCDLKLKVSEARFYDRTEQYSYPIKVVIYNHKSMLGYFDSDFYEIGFQECLMYASKKQLYDIIKHELAHYMTFINYGVGVQPHGVEFRAFCRELGWGEEVYQATCCLEGAQCAVDGEESGVLRKVKKLMALATSSNSHEAEQAMIKSQQLLLKHNIDSKYIGSEDEEKMVLKRILKQKRENAKMRSIAQILETFFVSTVYNRGGEYLYLEILGTLVNVEIAEYVAGVLHVELDRLWNQAQRQANLKGMVAKNSFFLGIARGYCNKIYALKREYAPQVKNALMVMENQLVEAKEMAYSRLSSRKSSGSYCQESALLGEIMGKGLNINPALKGSGSHNEALLAHLT